jgi:hypothetical protein
MVDSVDVPGLGGLYTIWGNDRAATVPDDGTQPAFDALYPPAGGFRVYMMTFPAGEAAIPEGKNLTGGGKMANSDIPGMHRSDTTDFDIVLKGSVDCILSDGTAITLKTGDTIVLNGADHAWRNSGTEDAQVLFFMAGARRI